MTLEEIPSGSRVLLDANTLIYNAVGRSLSCNQLLRRGERRDVNLLLSATTAAEARHALMLAEARAKGLISGSNPARRLGEKPDLVQQLSVYQDQERQLRGVVTLIELTVPLLDLSADVSRETGLLTNFPIRAAGTAAGGPTNWTGRTAAPGSRPPWRPPCPRP